MTHSFDAGGIHYIYGTLGSDNIYDTSGDDSIQCSDGDDSVTVQNGGLDYVHGGNGTDTLIIDYSLSDQDFYSNTDEYGASRLATDNSDPTVNFLSFEHVTITTGSGNDVVGVLSDFDAGGGVDTFRGFDASVWNSDTMAFHIDMEKMAAGGQEFQGHTIRNVERVSVLLSSLADSYLDGSGGFSDFVSAGDGDDVLQTLSGDDKFYGGDGDDLLIIDWADATGAVEIDSTHGWVNANPYVSDRSTSTRTIHFEEFEGLDIRSGSANDRLHGLSNHADIVDGGKGRDTWIDGFDDWGERGLTIKMKTVASAKGLTLADGSEVKNVEAAELVLTDRADTFVDFGSGDDTVSGMAGKDKFTTSRGRDAFHGGDGIDKLVVDWADATRGSMLSNNDGYPPHGYVGTGKDQALASRAIEFTNVEKLAVRFGSGDDVLFVANSSFAIKKCVADGGAGSDRLIGSLKDDALFGGAGDDYLVGRNGADKMSGGAGDDVMRGEDLGERRGDGWGVAGSDLMHGNAGADTLYGGEKNDRLYGNKGADKLYGEDGKDILHGGLKRDRLEGGSGNDTLYGDGGNDKLSGGGGKDWIEGGGGRDKLSGGAGADTFVISRKSGLDRVYDFKDGVDHIGLHGVTKAQVRVVDIGDHALVQLKSGVELLQLMNVDADNIGAADFWIV